MIASPQTEDGYTAIANELMIQICGIRIPGECRQIFDVILYKTYGWKKKFDWISLSQFEELTGVKKQNVRRSIRKLEEMNMIVIKKDNADNHIYGINKNYLSWEPLSKKITLSKKIKPVIKKDKASLSILSTTKETNTKETNTKEKIYKSEKVLEFWNRQQIIEHKQNDKIEKAYTKARKEFSEDEIIKAISNYKEIFYSSFYYSHKWTLENFLKQQNGISNFIEGGQVYENYKASIPIEQKKPSEITDEEFLEQAVKNIMKTGGISKEKALQSARYALSIKKNKGA